MYGVIDVEHSLVEVVFQNIHLYSLIPYKLIIDLLEPDKEDSPGRQKLNEFFRTRHEILNPHSFKIKEKIDLQTKINLCYALMISHLKIGNYTKELDRLFSFLRESSGKSKAEIAQDKLTRENKMLDSDVDDALFLKDEIEKIIDPWWAQHNKLWTLHKTSQETYAIDTSNINARLQLLTKQTRERLDQLKKHNKKPRPEITHFETALNGMIRKQEALSASLNRVREAYNRALPPSPARFELSANTQEDIAQFRMKMDAAIALDAYRAAAPLLTLDIIPTLETMESDFTNLKQAIRDFKTLPQDRPTPSAPSLQPPTEPEGITETPTQLTDTHPPAAIEITETLKTRWGALIQQIFDDSQIHRKISFDTLVHLIEDLDGKVTITKGSHGTLFLKNFGTGIYRITIPRYTQKSRICTITYS